MIDYRLQYRTRDPDPARFLEVMGQIAAEKKMTHPQIAAWCTEIVNDDEFWEPIIEDDIRCGLIISMLRMVKIRAEGGWMAVPTLEDMESPA